MGKIKDKNNPCLDPVCGSSDARQIYEDGTSFCFSCQKFFTAKDEEDFDKIEVAPTKIKVNQEKILEDIKEYPIRGFKERNVTKRIAEFYDVRVSYGTDGFIDSHYYPYPKGYKVRGLPKHFKWLGKSGGIFGKDKFNAGGRKLVICEGEIDTLVVAQANYDKYKKFYPVVGLSSASATEELLKERDWLRSFEEVILCFDEDAAGEEARERAIKIIGIDKVRFTKLPEHDADRVYAEKGSDTLLQCIWNAQKYIPPGIIGKEELWESLVKYNDTPSFPYPECIHGLNEKLKGMREGEISLFISGTGSGKSTLLREIMLHVLETSDEKIGVISLEESPAETARKLAGMVLKKNPASEEIPLDELKIGFDKVFGDDRVIVLNHGLELNDNSIMDQLEYMALSGCKKLFIDHITILVSEGIDHYEGNEAQDRIMNEFVRLTKRHPVWIGLVSHLRKVMPGRKSFEEGKMPTLDDIRGSGSIKQISSDIIAFARNLTAEGELERNTIKMSVLKSRFTGLTGPVPSSVYKFDTGRLLATEQEFEFIPETQFTKLP